MRDVVVVVAALAAAVVVVVAAIAIVVAFAVAAIAIAGRLSKVASIGKSSKAAVPLAVVVAEGCRPSLSSAVSRCRAPVIVINGGVTAPPASSWVVINGGVIAGRLSKVASSGRSSKAAVPLAVVVAESCRPSLSSAVGRCRPPAVVINGGVTALPASSWVVINGGVTVSRHQKIAALPSNAGNGALADRWNRLSLEKNVSSPNLLSAGHSAAAARLSASA